MREIYIGLMSGTSLDGIDVIAIDFASERPKTLHWYYTAYPEQLRHRLRVMLSPEWRGSLSEIGEIDAWLGDAYAEAVNSLLATSRLPRKDILAIGSHGQTLHHSPDTDPAFSMQLGDPNRIAEKTGIRVVADFRRRDIAAKGQGAPLVPAFHHDMFFSASENRVILNIGGIANITRLLPSLPVIGFDTGPGNTLLNEWIKKHRGDDYDRDGAWASTGVIDTDLLGEMLNESFFNQPPPKSTGRELFNLQWLESHRNINALKPENVQATLTELTAVSISQAIHLQAEAAEAIYVCGGGAYNKRLLDRLKAHNAERKVSATDELGIAPDKVEAAAFAWLARQTIEGLHGNLPEVTGATGNRILGGIFQA